MTMTDPISDLLTRIRNGHHARKAVVECLYSRTGTDILDVLKDEGYIRAYKVREVRTGISRIDVELKYFEGEPAIKLLERVSKPGRRMYSSVDDLPRPSNGLGVYVLSTSKGVISDAQARKENAGGEILCRVF